MLDVVVSHGIADLIHLHIGLHQQLLGALNPQLIQVRDERAAALLGETRAKIFFVKAHIIRYRLLRQFRVCKIILHKFPGPPDDAVLLFFATFRTGRLYPAHRVAKP